MPGISIPAKSSDAVALEKIYIEIRAAIRETDNISFKLLNLVPLVSGTALIGLLLQTRPLPAPLVMFLALSGKTLDRRASNISIELDEFKASRLESCNSTANTFVTRGRLLQNSRV